MGNLARDGGPLLEDGTRVRLKTVFEQLSLDSTKQYALLRDVRDVSTLIGYYTTFDAAKAAQEANTTGAGVPLIVVNEDYAA